MRSAARAGVSLANDVLGLAGALSLSQGKGRTHRAEQGINSVCGVIQCNYFDCDKQTEISLAMSKHTDISPCSRSARTPQPWHLNSQL